MGLSVKQKKQIDVILHSSNYTDYKWIDTQQIVVAQWVRMKCMFGCGEYGHGGTCPPNTPPVPECERFFKRIYRCYCSALYRQDGQTRGSPCLVSKDQCSANQLRTRRVPGRLRTFFCSFHGLMFFLQGVHQQPRNLRQTSHGSPRPRGNGCGCLFNCPPDRV